VRQKLDENRETIETLRQGFLTFVQFLADYVVPAIVTFYSLYLQKVIQFLGLIVTALIDVIAYWVNFVTKLVEVGVAISTFVSNAITSINSFLTSMHEAFTTAFNAVAGFIGGIFQGIYDTITGTVRDAVNLVIGQINRIVNAWNALSFTIPQFTVGVGQAAVSFGPYSFGTPDLPTIPELAKGGIVTEATLAIIGEAGPEAVVPLNRGGAAGLGGTTINVTVNAGMGADGAEVGRQVVDAIRAYERRNGRVYASA